MIISASRRTDIPALYAPWLQQRLQAGFCLVSNPFNPNQVSRVSLRPEDVDAVVFWTRHARPIFSLLPYLERHGYRFYFQYTITGYGPPVEKRSPPLPMAIRTFLDLAGRLAPGAVVWRYDPILLGPAFPWRDHVRRFEGIAAQLAGCTQRVVVSVVHLYRKAERRLAQIYRWDEDLYQSPVLAPELPELLARMASIAGNHGLVVEACAQRQDYSALGIRPSKCVDDRLLGQLFGGTWPSSKDPGQRPECGCVPSKDIGIIDTCTFGCVYCYATQRDRTARRRRREHDPASPLLWAARGDAPAPPPDENTT